LSFWPPNSLGQYFDTPIRTVLGQHLSVLDTNWGQGEDFFDTYRNWCEFDSMEFQLNYVVLANVSPNIKEFLDITTSNHPTSKLLIQGFNIFEEAAPLDCKFQRWTFNDGKCRLTICTGEINDLLKDLTFSSDYVYLKVESTTQEKIWGNTANIKLLKKLCRNGTQIVSRSSYGLKIEKWLPLGFICDHQKKFSTSLSKIERLSYEPTWLLKKTRSKDWRKSQKTGHCIVIGAGLSGASAAWSLAQRGWRVQVVETQSESAKEASSLPVGLMVPHISKDDSPLSKLSRYGIRLTLQALRNLLIEGSHWSNSGVEEVNFQDEKISKLFHPSGTWVKPKKLVNAYLSHPNIELHTDRLVTNIQMNDLGWILFDKENKLLGQTPHLICANAGGVNNLLLQLSKKQRSLVYPNLYGYKGFLTSAKESETPFAIFPDQPLNGAGSFIPKIQDGIEKKWYLGANFEPLGANILNDTVQHQQNLTRLEKLSPDLYKSFDKSLIIDKLESWTGIRWTSKDRLPVVGQIDPDLLPGLWICTGMGSRGLSMSLLCAEVLVARMNGEPLPIPASLAKSISIHRFNLY